MRFYTDVCLECTRIGVSAVILNRHLQKTNEKRYRLNHVGDYYGVSYQLNELVDHYLIMSNRICIWQCLV
jgi:hypothetical protein